MVIGIDFDNTIVCYDQLFYEVAIEKGLIPSSILANKQSVKTYLCDRELEDEWTKLQGEVYGSKISGARSFPGFKDFLQLALERNVPVKIVSHRTKYPILGEKHDLHLAGMQWLIDNEIVTQTGLTQKDVFFETTKEGKLTRIESEKCTTFIDDLTQILLDPLFPTNTRKIHFCPTAAKADTGLEVKMSWIEISKSLFL